MTTEIRARGKSSIRLPSAVREYLGKYLPVIICAALVLTALAMVLRLLSTTSPDYFG